MVRRLVLGCGAVGYRVVAALADRPDELYVLDPDADRVEALRGESIAAEHADPTGSSVLEDLEWQTDSVLVMSDDVRWNCEAARAARRAYPDATVIAYTGPTPPGTDRDALAGIADRLVDHGPTAATALLEAVTGEAGLRLRRLVGTLRGIDGHLGVVMHDNPDPDAIASAIALRTIAEAVGTEATASYYGDISHQENRALVNLLELDLRRLDPEVPIETTFDAVALVDHSRPGVNDQLPPETSVAVVIDHHPPREPVEARFVDLRSETGATSTLLTGYLRRLGIEPSTAVASALLYGIRVDTRGFGRDITPEDFDAAAYLLEYADQGVLAQVESPSVTGETLETIARSITNRRRRENVIAASVGWAADRDALAQAADRLLNMEGVMITFVYGIIDGTIIGSARTRGSDVDIGEVLRDAFGQIGSAGGHADMAGVQLPLGILGVAEPGADPATDPDGPSDAADVEAVVADVVTNRFFEVLEADRALGRGATFGANDLTTLVEEGPGAVDIPSGEDATD